MSEKPTTHPCPGGAGDHKDTVPAPSVYGNRWGPGPTPTEHNAPGSVASDPASAPKPVEQAAAAGADRHADQTAPPAAGTDRDVLDDGQEEVSSHIAVEAGLTKDPAALGPEDLAKAPMSAKTGGRPSQT